MKTKLLPFFFSFYLFPLAMLEIHTLIFQITENRQVYLSCCPLLNNNFLCLLSFEINSLWSSPLYYSLLKYYLSMSRFSFIFKQLGTNLRTVCPLCVLCISITTIILQTDFNHFVQYHFNKVVTNETRNK